MIKNKILTITLSTILASCGGETNEASQKKTQNIDISPAYGDTLIDASIGEVSVLVPWIATDAPSHAISGQIYDALLRYDKDLNLIGNLAKKWEVSSDNLSITFHLHNNIQWADEKPLTAHDVMASFEAITSPQTRTPYAGDYQMVERAEVINDYTFKVTYAEPFAPALASWATLSILPKHILDKTESVHDSSLMKEPVGSGPYTLKSWKVGKEVEMTANQNYFRGKPYIEGLRTRLITDTDAQFLELKSGKLDMMGLKPLQYTRLTDRKSFTDKFNKYRYLSNGYTYMGFKLDHPIFKHKEIRQALSYATPRDEIIQGALMGQGLPMAGVFKPGTWAYNDNLKPYPYNPGKAKAMLQNAGWSDTDGDGIIDKDGKPFKFTVITNQGNDVRKATAEIMQQAFSKIGVEMNIQIQEWSTFIENTINGRDFEAFILGWSLSAEPDPYDIWHSSKTGEREFNIVGFNNPAADEHMVKARKTFDQATRKQHLDAFQEILHDEQPYLFLYAPYSLIAISNRVHGIAPAPAGISYNQTEWFVPKALQIHKNSITP